METSLHSHSHSHFLKPPLPAVDHRVQFELYTIPAASAWFSWDNIHDIEKASLPEFFNGSSFTRNPRVYKEYRDFIISKFREDPSRRLAFSEVRRSLVGDVGYLLNVFRFLEKCGLVNYGAELEIGGGGGDELVRVEGGTPNGVRVVAVPNSVKPVLLMDVGADNGFYLCEGDFKLSPLASCLDVYQELIELMCAGCKELCESGYYECTKDGSSIICTKCFKNGDYGSNKSVDDYTFVDHTPNNGTRVATWTEVETLLLLETVLKHGDDWDLVAQNVQTKSKLDCISKLMQLPFGHLMLGPTYNRCKNNKKQGFPAPHETKDTKSQHLGTQSQHLEIESKCQQNGDAEADADVDTEGPPPKRIRIAPILDSINRKTEEIKAKDGQNCELNSQKHLPNVGNTLMQQVACISAVIGPQVTASAAEAAVTALCDENKIPKELFDNEENENDLIPLSLRVRATCATSLGAAAAHAKLLAVQEDKEVERLVSLILNTQLKKLEYKMGLLNESRVIMERECNKMVEVEEVLLTEQLDIVEKVIDGGLSRWRDKTMVMKAQEEAVL